MPRQGYPVKYGYGTWNEYQSITPDSDTVYFITDKNLIIVGGQIYSGTSTIKGINEIPQIFNDVYKDEIDLYISALKGIPSVSDFGQLYFCSISNFYYEEKTFIGTGDLHQYLVKSHKLNDDESLLVYVDEVVFNGTIIYSGGANSCKVTLEAPQGSTVSVRVYSWSKCVTLEFLEDMITNTITPSTDIDKIPSVAAVKSYITSIKGNDLASLDSNGKVPLSQLPIDSKIDPTSQNPVENQSIYSALEGGAKNSYNQIDTYTANGTTKNFPLYLKAESQPSSVTVDGDEAPVSSYNWNPLSNTIEFTGDAPTSGLVIQVTYTPVGKVDKDGSKGLSTNDFTDKCLARLNNIPFDGGVSQSDWSIYPGTDEDASSILNRPNVVTNFNNVANEEICKFSGNGTTKLFNLTVLPTNPRYNVIVTVGGNIVTNYVYTPAPAGTSTYGTIEFTNAPVTGTDNIVVYNPPELMSASCIKDNLDSKVDINQGTVGLMMRTDDNGDLVAVAYPAPEQGKGWSTQDFTTDDKNKLDAMPAWTDVDALKLTESYQESVTNYQNPDWNSGVNEINYSAYGQSWYYKFNGTTDSCIMEGTTPSSENSIYLKREGIDTDFIKLENLDEVTTPESNTIYYTMTRTVLSSLVKVEISLYEESLSNPYAPPADSQLLVKYIADPVSSQSPLYINLNETLSTRIVDVKSESPLSSVSSPPYNVIDIDDIIGNQEKPACASPEEFYVFVGGKQYQEGSDPENLQEYEYYYNYNIGQICFKNIINNQYITLQYQAFDPTTVIVNVDGSNLSNKISEIYPPYPPYPPIYNDPYNYSYDYNTNRVTIISGIEEPSGTQIDVFHGTNTANQICSLDKVADTSQALAVRIWDQLLAEATSQSSSKIKFDISQGAPSDSKDLLVQLKFTENNQDIYITQVLGVDYTYTYNTPTTSYIEFSVAPTNAVVLIYAINSNYFNYNKYYNEDYTETFLKLTTLLPTDNIITVEYLYYIEHKIVTRYITKTSILNRPLDDQATIDTQKLTKEIEKLEDITIFPTGKSLSYIEVQNDETNTGALYNGALDSSEKVVKFTVPLTQRVESSNITINKLYANIYSVNGNYLETEDFKNRDNPGGNVGTNYTNDSSYDIQTKLLNPNLLTVTITKDGNASFNYGTPGPLSVEVHSLHFTINQGE